MTPLETVHESMTVMAVFDPDGHGRDFAYTVGLADHGLPELHIWARPSLGTDPAPDFVLSQRDCHHFLTEAARRLAAGELAPGDEFTRDFVEGTSARFVVGEPVDPDTVEAFGARSAEVLPLRWELRRPVAPADDQLDDAERALIQRTFLELRDLTWSALPVVVPTSMLPEPPPVDAAQPLGPWEHVIRLISTAAKLAPERSIDVIDRMFCDPVELGSDLSVLCEQLRMRGRGHLRGAVFDLARADGVAIASVDYALTGFPDVDPDQLRRHTEDSVSRHLLAIYLACAAGRPAGAGLRTSVLAALPPLVGTPLVPSEQPDTHET